MEIKQIIYALRTISSNSLTIICRLAVGEESDEVGKEITKHYLYQIKDSLTLIEREIDKI